MWRLEDAGEKRDSGKSGVDQPTTLGHDSRIEIVHK
jgi:hypothetical protein